MTHSHNHSGHAHHTASSHKRLLIALGITALVFVAQLVGAFITRSVAIIGDAGHLFTDLAGLTMAATASYLASRPATHRHTWGFRRAEIIAALLQGLALLGIGIFITIESIQRLMAPADVTAGPMLWFGMIGLLGNILAMLVLSSARNTNLNLRAAFLEVTTDALGSVAVIAAAIIMTTTGYARADSIAALLIAVMIAPRAIALLRQTIQILMEATPPELDLADVKAKLTAVPNVIEVHDLHASLIATGMPVVTAHVVIRDAAFTPRELNKTLLAMQECLKNNFEISVTHSTFQCEPQTMPAHDSCADAALAR